MKDVVLSNINTQHRLSGEGIFYLPRDEDIQRVEEEESLMLYKEICHGDSAVSRQEASCCLMFR